MQLWLHFNARGTLETATLHNKSDFKFHTDKSTVKQIGHSSCGCHSRFHDLHWKTIFPYSFCATWIRMSTTIAGTLNTHSSLIRPLKVGNYVWLRSSLTTNMHAPTQIWSCVTQSMIKRMRRKINLLRLIESKKIDAWGNRTLLYNANITHTYYIWIEDTVWNETKLYRFLWIFRVLGTVEHRIDRYLKLTSGDGCLLAWNVICIQKYLKYFVHSFCGKIKISFQYSDGAISLDRRYNMQHQERKAYIYI